ncbi:MAG: zinc-binding dehydrogenase [Firmicutes bacterium]|nr:zinc-binding dehydrogenase [Bacillota bacterium]
MCTMSRTGKCGCGAEWEGACPYTEYVFNGLKTDGLLRPFRARVSEIVCYSEQLKVVRLAVPAGFAQRCRVPGSYVLVESLGCIIRGYKGLYHTDYTNYVRTDGAKQGGRIAILGGAGPMGIGSVELALGYAGVKQVIVTDLSQERLDFAAQKCSPEKAAQLGIDLRYVNTSGVEDPTKLLLEISEGGFDDVFVMVPVAALFTMAEAICREDGCINFFAGPTVHDLPGSLNLYRVHYDGIHVVGTAGSIPEDMTDIIKLIEEKKINPGALVSHILGLNAVSDTLFAMEKPSGAKKVCYNELDLPLIAIADLPELGKTDPMYKVLAQIVERNDGLWCGEAEEYLLAHAPRL